MLRPLLLAPIVLFVIIDLALFIAHFIFEVSYVGFLQLIFHDRGKLAAENHEMHSAQQSDLAVGLAGLIAVTARKSG